MGKLTEHKIQKIKSPKDDVKYNRLNQYLRKYKTC